jgi:hypothetical protein
MHGREKDYKEKLGDTEKGAPAKSLRVALGALIIKEKLQISDREVVEQIRENPYVDSRIIFMRYPGKFLLGKGEEREKILQYFCV